MRDDDQSSFSILLTCGGVCVLVIKLGVVENVEIMIYLDSPKLV